MDILKANAHHLAAILSLSRLATGRDDQADRLRHAITLGEVRVALADRLVQGYLTFNREFFERPFIWLLAVDPVQRRRGVGSSLIAAVEFEIGTGAALFTSTNQSNSVAQRFFEALGFAPTGFVENLDPGDPEIFYFKQL